MAGALSPSVLKIMFTVVCGHGSTKCCMNIIFNMDAGTTFSKGAYHNECPRRGTHLLCAWVGTTANRVCGQQTCVTALELVMYFYPGCSFRLHRVCVANAKLQSHAFSACPDMSPSRLCMHNMCARAHASCHPSIHPSIQTRTVVAASMRFTIP